MKRLNDKSPITIKVSVRLTQAQYDWLVLQAGGDRRKAEVLRQLLVEAMQSTKGVSA